MNLLKASFKINVNDKELNNNYLLYDDDKDNKLYNFEEEENDEYESEKSEESEDKMTFTKE